jgi:preprotein translocase subunit SecA
MLQSIITKVFGDPNEKKLKKYNSELSEIKKVEVVFEREFTTLESVQSKTREFMTRFE